MQLNKHSQQETTHQLQLCCAKEKINFVFMKLCKKSLGGWSPTGLLEAQEICVLWTDSFSEREREIWEQQMPWQLNKSKLQRKIKAGMETESSHLSSLSLKNMFGTKHINTLL